MSVHFEKHQIVVPGELLSENSFRAGEGTFTENGKIFASVIGLAEIRGNTVFVVPLEGFYFPKVGDVVLGKVVGHSPVSVKLDINSPYPGKLPIEKPRGRGMRSPVPLKLNVGDMIVGEIISFDRSRDPIITIRDEGLGKVHGGQIIRMSPAKVPRLIGRKGSMIKMIKDQLGQRIRIGQNGLVWFSSSKPEDAKLFIQIVRLIEHESHTSGLTDRIKNMIEKERGKKNDKEK
ncbi:MAG: exosome complex RNA-binding protein Rrp4 [Promethearchaeota archaeon]